MSSMPRTLTTLLLACHMASVALGQQVVAHYDFSLGSSDLTGQRGPVVLAGAANISGGTLNFGALGDSATFSIPGSVMYVSGKTKAIEIEARLRTDAILGYGTASASILALTSAWNAFLQMTHDKWSYEPAQIMSGTVGQIATKTEFAPYWTVGVDHHLRMLIDNTHATVWVDGVQVKQVTGSNIVAAWARTNPATMTMGSCRGLLREVIVKRWDNEVPSYPANPPPFGITAVTWPEEDRVQVWWNSTPGKTYTLETSADGVNWTPRADTIYTATALTSYMEVQNVASGHHYVRVTEGNIFSGQGPVMVSHADGATLQGTAVYFEWVGNVSGAQQWQVLAGSAPGSADYFQSPIIPASSSMFPVSGLPGRGETVYVTLRFMWNNAWQQKVFTYHAMQCDDIPLDREGAYPVMRPTYAGIKQVLLLSNKWLIVAVNDQADVTARIDQLSGGLSTYYSNLWMAGEPAGNSPNWTAWTQAPIVRDTYLAQVRTERDEARYERPSYFSISSVDDASYGSPQSPSTARRYYVGLNKAELPGSGPIHYAHYCYLEMPQAMQNGKHYTITLGDGKSASFTYDEMASVSRAIKLNQNGYLPDAGKKYAYIGAWIPNYGPLPLAQATTFNVVNAQTGAIALSGAITLRESNPRFRVKPGDNSTDPATRPLMHGEDVYQIDLSGLTEAGNFFISVPGVGRSWSFRHGADAYGEAFFLSARGMFHQRAAMKYAMPYTPWSRIKAHYGPVYESSLIGFGFGDFAVPSFDRFDVVGGSTDLTKATTNVLGGWYDAADYDRNLRHYTNIFDMLYAYELAPAKFSDNMLNIPESGNGIPDLLDEAEYGLDVWTRSMTADGGVSGRLETNSHPTLTDTNFKWTFSRRTRWCSLLYAAAAAQFAELVAPFDSVKSQRYRDLAIKAFSFGNNPANSLGSTVMHAKTNRGAGTDYDIAWTELDKYIDPYLFHAKLRLYYLTQDSTYLVDIQNNLANGATPWQWPNTYKDCVPWFYFNIAKRGAGIFPQTLIDSWRARYVSAGNTLKAQLDGQSYRQTWPNYQDWSLAWGESCYTNRARTLFMVYALTNDASYRDAAICDLDYMFGANPMGMSWTTGIGFTYPAVLQHEVSEKDGIDDPVPGLTLYGIDGGPINHLVRNNAWSCPANPANTASAVFYNDPMTPLYRRWIAHPTGNPGQDEFTIWETMSATTFCCGMLLPDGWTPPASLKQRRPRNKDSLFGYWYLP